jgi:hypothetical protein
VDWLLSLHRHRLPALLADESGLGRKATVSAFLSALPREGRQGTALLVCPVSSLAAWQTALALHAPALSFLLYSGTPADRRRLREEAVFRDPSPHLLITSYRTLFLDASWFLSRSWAVLIQAEAQNVISAGSSDQLRCLVSLKAQQQRILLVSGHQKANPIDLWHTVYLLYPGVMKQREEQCEAEVEVEGTQEYQDTVNRLQGFITSFTISRSRSKCLGTTSSGENKVWLSLAAGQRARYEDFLAKPDSQVLYCTVLYKDFLAKPDSQVLASVHGRLLSVTAVLYCTVQITVSHDYSTVEEEEEEYI